MAFKYQDIILSCQGRTLQYYYIERRTLPYMVIQNRHRALQYQDDTCQYNINIAI